jgi:hypothetical protein
MDENKLRADYNGPRMTRRIGQVQFHWSRKGRKPTHRYALTYDPATRRFSLNRYHRTSAGRSEHAEPITDPAMLDLFRYCLRPEQVAYITRLSMERAHRAYAVRLAP